MSYARILVKQKDIGVNNVCSLLNFSKSTYYKCKDRDEAFKEKYASTRAFIERIIKNNSFYGVKRIQAELNQTYGVEVGRDALGRLLKLWGLSLKRRVCRTKPSMIRKILLLLANKTNILIRSNVTEPLQAVSSDISELKYRYGKVYLCVHKDVVGQMVYGYSLSTVMDTALVKKSFMMALRRMKKLLNTRSIKNKDIIFHSDQGSQYTSYEYVQSVLDVGRISYSTPGTPTENPGQESFFGRLKDECRNEITELESAEEVVQFVHRRIRYYNTRRLHTSINYQSPFSFTKAFVKKGLGGMVISG